ncbi:S-acyl fatty acid synthase thioesterase, medium chain [Oryzias melastigma]|uniref:S-acyl fatty acid synthase thioesterase, medium chain n=1 Tax=Oryzias melastigma TaxID=30732 RepID=A0A3B3CT13_ORYME|nr:S-acyl fatty acid synthase thioesterase, medium chain [Oryzias melastigma]
MDSVLNCLKRRPDAVARLVCFPWAGGGSVHFARWGHVMDSVEVFAVKLPGRESRFREPFFQNMDQIVDEVVAALLPILDEKPFALFGHSFGALTSFAVAERMRKLHNVEPVHMFLSGAFAPFSELRLKSQRRSELSDEDFLQWLTAIGGTPPELLANPEVVRLFLPALKADLRVVESYRCARPESPLFRCSLSCLDGKDDLPHNLQEWKCITSGEFTIRMFDGAHFYLKTPGNEKLLLDYMSRHLETSQLDYL